MKMSDLTPCLIGQGQRVSTASKAFGQFFAVVVLVTTVFGCASEKPPTNEVTCVPEISPIQHHFQMDQPNLVRKTSVETCSNYCQVFTALDGSGVSETLCE